MLDADEAVQIIQRCVDAGRFTLDKHFTKRMEERYFWLSDVWAMVEQPLQVRLDGEDDENRVRCLLRGKTTFGELAELLVVFETPPARGWTTFITIYSL